MLGLWGPLSTLDSAWLWALKAYYLPQITAHPKVGWVTAPALSKCAMSELRASA